jgi:signal peptidase I
VDSEQHRVMSAVAVPATAANSATGAAGATSAAPIARAALSAGVPAWEAAANLALAVACTVAIVVVLALSVGPRFFAYETFIVRSGSMEPSIRTGALVVVQPVQPASIRTGDVITYRRPEDPDNTITHRVVEVRSVQGAAAPTFRTRGDANNANDPWEVQLQGIAWRVAFSVPFAGYVFAFTQQPGSGAGPHRAGRWSGAPLAPTIMASPAPALRQPRPQGIRRTLSLLGQAILFAWVAIVLVVIGLSQGPRLAGYRVFIVRSGSMAPTIPTGSAVLVRGVPPESLRVGDVITFERTDGGQPPVTVTHRIVEIVQPGPPILFRTKGDANTVADPVTVSYVGDAGKVDAHVPFAGYALNAVGHPAARLALIGVPALLLGLSFIRDLWRRPA